MPKVNLSGMNVEALLSLRGQVDKRLLELRAELEKHLAAWAEPSPRLRAIRHLKARESHRNIVAHLARLGQVVGRSLGGWLRL